MIVAYRSNIAESSKGRNRGSEPRNLGSSPSSAAKFLMLKIPKFILYGEGNPETEQATQPALALRQWNDLSRDEKMIALKELENNQWLKENSRECLETISYLNHTYLRQCPGKRLHGLKPEYDARGYGGNEHDRQKVSIMDFKDIFLNEESNALVLRMLSKFTQAYIDSDYLSLAQEAKEEAKRKEYAASAFAKFDRLANCLNHVFKQFAINQVVTRNGFVPQQDEKITEKIYIPTLQALSDPKWASVSEDLARMFEDYRDGNYAEAITKAHSTVQRFFQVLVGEEGKSGKGELGKLFKKAKEEGVIPTNRFTDSVISAISGFIPSERATN